MNRLLMLLGSDFCGNLLAALLHSLWQGLVIAGLLLAFLRTRAAKDANVRYIAGLVGLSAVVLCVFFTWAVLDYEPQPAGESISGNVLSELPTATATHIESSSAGNSTGTETPESGGSSTASAGIDWRAWAICLWLGGVVVMLLRLVCVAVGGSSLRRQCEAPDNEQLLTLVKHMRRDIGIARRIPVAVSERISVPGVAGCIWPTLLLPVSMVSGVPTGDLRAILAHELAHIKRYDYLANFCQMVIEAFLFFNPAVWWISKQIRIEREACCDQAGITATGQAIRYAEILADWARRLKQVNATTAGPAIGFGKADDSGSLLERIRRIIITGHRPKLRVSWYIATITLIVSLALLVGIWRGTTMTVAVAAKLLTPQERIDKIREIERDHLTFENREFTQVDQITISGSVRTIDGKPLDKMAVVRISSKGPKNSSTKGIQISRGDEGPFSSYGLLSAKVNYGIIRLHVKAQGYAPAFAGPLSTRPGGEIKDLNFILDKGFTAKLKIVNEDKEPVGGASIVGDYQHNPGVSYNDIKLTTDEDGFAIVENAVDKPAQFSVMADWYEAEKFEDIRLSSGQPAVLKLKRTRETTGVVLSKETGEPVPGATIRVLMVMKLSRTHSYGPDDGPVLTAADERGRFALRTLRSDSQYLLSVEDTGLGHKLMYNVIPGQENLIIHLPGKIRIAGRITGPIEKLPERNGKRVINYSSGIDFDHHSHWTSGKHAPVELRDGQGYFEIKDIPGNRLSIGSGGYRKVIDIERERPGEVVIDLAHKVTEDGREYKNRELILKFDCPEGSPAPEGKLQFKYIDPDFAVNTYRNREVAIRDGQGTIEIPAPGKVGYDNQGIAGYWFSEKSEIQVPYAEDSFVITIPAVPAGSIYGEVFEADGSKADNVLVAVVAVEKSPLMGKSPFLNVEGKSTASEGEPDARYVISPLPLGGKYVVIAHKKYLYTVSEQIMLDETGPIRRLDMTLPEGRAFDVRIVDENGKAMPSVPVKLDYDTPWNHGFSREAMYTNAEGKLVVERFNPNVPGSYWAVVKDLAGYRPVRKKIVNTQEPLEIKLEKGHVVTGIVVDVDTGMPIPGVEVYALPTDFSVPEPTTYLDADQATDKQGRFRFSTMAKREYQLNVRSGRLMNPRGSEVVTGGRAGQVILRVKLRQSSEIKSRIPVLQNN